MAAILLPLTAWPDYEQVGHPLVLAIATGRHHSANILARLGGFTPKAQGIAVRPYYDAKYGCEMELVGFDSRNSNPRFAAALDEIGGQLSG